MSTLRYALIVVIMWVGLSSLIQALKCPELTQTELLFLIPYSVLCNWATVKPEGIQ